VSKIGKESDNFVSFAAKIKTDFNQTALDNIVGSVKKRKRK